MAVTSAPIRTRGVTAASQASGGPALEHRIPVPPDLGDLAHVIHHPHAVEAGVLGGDRGRRQAGGDVVPRERRDVQPEAHGRRPVPLLRGEQRRRPQVVGATARTGSGRTTRSNPSASRSRGSRSSGRAAASAWPRAPGGGWPGCGPGIRPDRRRSPRRRRGGRGPRPSRDTPAVVPDRGRGCRPRSSAVGRDRWPDDGVEQGEGVAGGLEIVLTVPDDGPEPVARHDLVVGEVLGGPVDLPADEGPISTTTQGTGRCIAASPSAMPQLGTALLAPAGPARAATLAFRT